MAATVHSINSQINVIFFINGKTEIALFACNICYPFLCHTCIAEWTYRDHYPLLTVACNICYPFLCHTCIAEWTYRDHYPLLSVACNICYPFLCHTCIAEWTYRDHYPLLSVLNLQLLLNHQLKHDLLRCCRVMGFCS